MIKFFPPRKWKPTQLLKYRVLYIADAVLEQAVKWSSSLSLLLSGGDDQRLCLWSKGGDLTSSCKDFEGGVTRIELVGDDTDDVIVGSYDQSLTRFSFSGQTLSAIWKVDVGGGVWRVAIRGNLALVAAMYGGSVVVDVSAGGATVGDRFKVHESMVYGAQWMGGGGGGLKATCSFYDKLVCVW